MAAIAHSTMHEPDFSRYLRQACRVPMLTDEEELALARRCRDGQDKDAEHRLVMSHLRLVARVAAGYRGYGLPYSELVSEGAVGLIRAVRRFDPDRGFRLATYAVWWIRAAIQEFVLHAASLVRMGTTVIQKRLFFNLRRMTSQLGANGAGDLQPEHVSRIARLLDAPEKTVIDMHRRMATPDQSLNVEMHDDSSEQWQDSIADDADDQESVLADREELAQRRERLAAAMQVLDDREKRIVAARWLKDDPATLDDLAECHGVSAERIRQIESRAFNKLRLAMNVPPSHGSPRRPATPAARLPMPAVAPSEQWQPGWWSTPQYSSGAARELVPA